MFRIALLNNRRHRRRGLSLGIEKRRRAARIVRVARATAFALHSPRPTVLSWNGGYSLVPYLRQTGSRWRSTSVPLRCGHSIALLNPSSHHHPSIASLTAHSCQFSQCSHPTRLFTRLPRSGRPAESLALAHLQCLSSLEPPCAFPTIQRLDTTQQPNLRGRHRQLRLSLSPGPQTSPAKRQQG